MIYSHLEIMVSDRRDVSLPSSDFSRIVVEIASLFYTLNSNSTNVYASLSPGLTTLKTGDGIQGRGSGSDQVGRVTRRGINYSVTIGWQTCTLYSLRAVTVDYAGYILLGIFQLMVLSTVV